MGYVDETMKQYKVYAPDLQMTVRSSIVDFKEEMKGGTVDLNLLGEHPQGTPNVLTVRKPIGRPKEPLLPVMELPPQEKLNNFEIIIPSQKPESAPSQFTNPTRSEDKTPVQEHAQDPAQDSAWDSSQEQPAPSPQTPVTGPYNLRKCNQDQDQEAETDDKIAK